MKIMRAISQNLLDPLDDSNCDIISKKCVLNYKKPIEIEAQIKTLKESNSNIITKILYCEKKRLIILAYFTGIISIWDYDTFEKLSELNAHQFQITDIILMSVPTNNNVNDIAYSFYNGTTKHPMMSIPSINIPSMDFMETTATINTTTTLTIDTIPTTMDTLASTQLIDTIAGIPTIDTISGIQTMSTIADTQIMDTLAAIPKMKEPCMRYLVSSSYDGMIKFWDLTTFTCVKVLKGVTFLWIHDIGNSYLLSYSNMYYQLWYLGNKNFKPKTNSKLCLNSRPSNMDVPMMKWKAYTENIKSNIIKIDYDLYIMSSLGYIEVYKIRKEQGMKLCKKYEMHDKFLIKRISIAPNMINTSSSGSKNSQEKQKKFIFVTYDFLDMIDMCNIYTGNIIHRFKANYAIDYILSLKENIFLSGGIDEGISVWDINHSNEEPIYKIMANKLAGYNILVPGDNNNTIIMSSFDIEATKLMKVHIVKFDEEDILMCQGKNCRYQVRDEIDYKEIFD